jgi:hypothetical protein
MASVGSSGIHDSSAFHRLCHPFQGWRGDRHRRVDRFDLLLVLEIDMRRSTGKSTANLDALRLDSIPSLGNHIDGDLGIQHVID